MHKLLEIIREFKKVARPAHSSFKISSICMRQAHVNATAQTIQYVQCILASNRDYFDRTLISGCQTLARGPQKNGSGILKKIITSGMTAPSETCSRRRSLKTKKVTKIIMLLPQRIKQNNTKDQGNRTDSLRTLYVYRHNAKQGKNALLKEYGIISYLYG